VSGPVSVRGAFCAVFLPLSAPGPAAVNSSVYLDHWPWTLFRNPAYVYSERASSGSLDPTGQRDDREADTAVGANPQRGDLSWPFRPKICSRSPRSWPPATYAIFAVPDAKIDLIPAPLRAFMDTRLTPPRKETALENQVREQIEALQHMTVGQLREKYHEVFGEESRSYHKQFLFRRIAWRLQANAEGGLSERARQRALEIANDADLRVTAPKGFDLGATPGRSVTRKLAAVDPRLPPPGQEVRRKWRGQSVVVKVRTNGFEYNGRIYKSLSAIAHEVTGTKTTSASGRLRSFRSRITANRSCQATAPATAALTPSRFQARWRCKTPWRFR